MLSGLTAVVTGGNGGIGLGIARALAEAGADVAIWGRDEAKTAAAVEDLAGLGTQIASCTCDISDEASVTRAFAETVRSLGKVDAFVANAGIGGGGDFLSTTLEDWRAVTAVNLDGTFLCLREASRHMVERGEGGALVAVTSLTVLQGAAGVEAYSASKSGVAGLMRCLAVDLARHRIRSNSIMPGWVATDLNEALRTNERFMTVTTSRTPVRRWGGPDDVGQAAVFLADPKNLFHTGDTVVVDGGYSIF